MSWYPQKDHWIIQNRLKNTDTIPSGASLYALLSVEQMHGTKSLDPRKHVVTGNIRVPIKLKKNPESHEGVDHDESSSENGKLADDNEPPEWLKKVTQELLEKREEEDMLDPDILESGNISPKSNQRSNDKTGGNKSKNNNRTKAMIKTKPRRNTTIVIGQHFPVKRPVAEEEKIMTRNKIKQMSRVLVKKHNVYDKLSRKEPNSPRTAKNQFLDESNDNLNESNETGDKKGNRRKRTTSTQNELKLLSGSWTQNVKHNLLRDAGKYLDDLHKEMEIKEKIMKGKERTRRESIKPTMPAYNAAMKARRPTQSPNKMRRKMVKLCLV
eukprot:g1035.t1